MVLYASILEHTVVQGALGHVLIASIVNVFGAVVIARVMVPSSGGATEGGDVEELLRYSSLMDAIMRGTSDGLRLVVNIGAMLIVLVSLIALVNAGLGVFDVAGAPLALERIMGWLFAPVAWLMGVPWHEAVTAGSILGTKLVLNELVAYIQLAGLSPDALGENSRLILTYALCGFANFGSLGIMLGGLIALVPERRDELLVLAPKTVLSGTLVNCMTGAIVGLVLSPGS
jgi:CNT family concentrative nucleoside transporter